MRTIMSTIMSTHYDLITVITITTIVVVVIHLYASRDMAIPITMVLGSLWGP